MSETNNCELGAANFKEAVCIDAGRVYDSCCDRDCLEDLRCFFTCEAQECVNKAISVRLKSAEILNVFIDVEPVSFNKGFYSCDLTFFFLMNFDVFHSPNCCPTSINGISAFSKKVILYGSDGNVQVFSSLAGENCTNDTQSVNTAPKCVVQCVDPVVLTARLGKIRDCYENVRYIPKQITEYLGGEIETNLEAGTPTIYATIGLFTIVQLIRNVQMLIPVYDFCIPEKQCEDSTDRPCDVFRKIKFPTDDFFPPRNSNENSCSLCTEE